ncbi:snakin-2-like [Ananas comosus]|uniref:Snakin-2-like n=1 Tax=Ananas comosus TaxID=4615 RepID=A0A6P5GZD0_ANACO|nr:snakin-2-like [Ananas comosus]
MALSKPPIMAFLFLSMLVLQSVDSRPTVDDNLVITSNNGTSLLEAPKIDCRAACAARCSRSRKNKMCRKMCGIYCSKCSCVPPALARTPAAAAAATTPCATLPVALNQQIINYNTLLIRNLQLNSKIILT